MSEHENDLSVVVAAYLQAIDAGKDPDPEDWIARHPEMAEPLRAFFEEQRRMKNRMASLQEESSEGETTDGNDQSQTEELPESIRSFGDYEIEREIARGGMGIVYRARQLSLNRPVALKMIRAGQFADETEVRRFRDEAEAAANLDHPNIVPIYEVGEHEGRHYFSMTFIDGENLSRHHSRYASSPKAMAQLMAVISEAVHHAHQRGILHRDLKPENVQMDAEGQPHVTDFGLAKRLGSNEGQTQTGATVGTPEYLSPEQAHGEKSLTVTTDVHGLGTILYVLLTGRPPFQSDNLLETIRQVREDDPVPPGSLQSGTSRDLETICLKCLRKDPGQRYGSAQELAEDLRRFLRGEPIQARPVGRLERAAKWSRRRPMTTALIVVLACGLPLLAWLNLRLSAANEHLSTQTRIAENKTRVALEAEREAEEKRKAEAEARSKAETAEAEKTKALQQEVLARKDADARNYALSIMEAYLRWQNNDLRRAERRLDECREEDRGWEWDYVKGLCHSEILSMDVTGKGLTFTRNGRYLLTTDSARKKVGEQTETEAFVHFWDLMTGEKARTVSLGTSPGSVAGTGFSPDGSRCAIAIREPDANGKAAVSIKVCDLATGKERLRLPLKEGLYTFQFNRGSRSLTTVGRQAVVQTWDMTNGREIASATIRDTFESAQIPGLNPFPGGRVNPANLPPDQAAKVRKMLEAFGPPSVFSRGFLTISQNGAYLAGATRGGIVKIWESATGKEIRALKMSFRELYYISALSWSPDSSRLAVVRGDVAQVYDTSTGNPVLSLSLRGGSDSAAPTSGLVQFSPDGRFLLLPDESMGLRVCDASTGRELNRLRGLSGEMARSQTAFLPGGFRLATRQGNTIKVWDLTTRPQHRSYPRNGGPVRSLDFSPDGRFLVVACQMADNELGVCRISVYEANAGLLVQSFTGHRSNPTSVLFFPDGNRIASSDESGKVLIWNWRSKRILKRLKATVDELRLSPDGQYLMGRDSSGITVWKCDTIQQLHRLEAPASAMGFNAQGHLLAVGKKTLTKWDVAEGRKLSSKPFQVAGTERFTISPNGTRMASVRYGGRNSKGGRLAPAVSVQDLQSGKLLQSIPIQSRCSGVAFTPDGKRLLISGWIGSRTIPMYDIATGTEIFTFRGPLHMGQFGPPGTGASLRFSKDGTRLAYGSLDHNVWSWNAWRFDSKGRKARFNALVQALPDLHFREGKEAAANGHFGIALFHSNRAVARLPDHPELRQQRAEIFAELGLWARAERDFIRMLKNPVKPDILEKIALLKLKRGNQNGYQRLCAGLLRSVKPGSNPSLINTVNWMCALGPKAIADLGPVLKSQRVLLSAHPRDYAMSNTLGALLYRAGRWKEAVDHLEKKAIPLQRGGGTPGDWIFLAMAHQRLGGTTEAVKYIEKTEKYLKDLSKRKAQQPGNPKLSWLLLIELDLLYQEAKALVQKSNSPGAEK